VRGEAAFPRRRGPGALRRGTLDDTSPGIIDFLIEFTDLLIKNNQHIQI
jgi:hypothetical protein